MSSKQFLVWTWLERRHCGCSDGRRTPLSSTTRWICKRTGWCAEGNSVIECSDKPAGKAVIVVTFQFRDIFNEKPGSVLVPGRRGGEMSLESHSLNKDRERRPEQRYSPTVEYVQL